MIATAERHIAAKDSYELLSRDAKNKCEIHCSEEEEVTLTICSIDFDDVSIE